jgi:hypothetical protein
MTVNTTNITSGPYSGNGITTGFSYTFRAELKTQLLVYVKDASNVITTKTVDTDYTVSGLGDDDGGVVTFLTAPVTGETVYIRSNYQATQDTDFDSQGGFFPDVHEAAIDKLTFQIQQLQDQVNRSLRININDDTGSLDPLAEITANSFLRANATADGYDHFTLPSVGVTAEVPLASYDDFRNGTASFDIDDYSDGQIIWFTNNLIFGAFVLRTGASPADNGGTVIRSTVDTNRYVERVFSGAASVKWFGATGDGVTDDSAACQAALDNHQAVLFDEPDTAYLIENELIPPTNRLIIGRRGKIEAGAGLQIAAAQAFVFRLNNNGITFKDMIINVDYSVFPRNASDEAKVGAIYGTGRNNITLENCTITGGANFFQASGFIATGLIEIRNSAFIRLENCFVRGDYSAAWSGSAAGSEICKILTCTDVSIIGGVYRQSFYSCIAVGVGGERVIIDGVQADTCIGSVISFNAQDATLANSVIGGSRDEGGVAMGHPSSASARCKVLGNTIYDCGRSGVSVAYPDAIIANNNIRDCETASPSDTFAAAIAIGDSANPTTYRNRASVSGNVIRGCYNGIVVSDSSLAGEDGSDYAINGNVVSNCTNAGIYSSAPNVSIVGNVTRSNDRNIQIETTRSTNNIVTANTVVSGVTYGILASSPGSGTRIWGNTDVNNTANSIAHEELTIATGEITITSDHHFTVDTESDAATDDLVTINGGIDGQVVTLSPDNDTRTVVVKDGSNLQLNGDFTMDSNVDMITLKKIGSNWREVSRSDVSS